MGLRDKISDFFWELFAWVVFIAIVFFFGKIYFSNDYSIIVSIKSLACKDTLYRLDLNEFDYYSHNGLLGMLLNLDEDKIKEKAISFKGIAKVVNQEEYYIIIESDVFDSIKCEIGNIDKAKREMLSQGETYVICGYITEKEHMNLDVKVIFINKDIDSNINKYDFADGAGEIHNNSSWVERQFGGIAFKMPGWWMDRAYDDPNQFDKLYQGDESFSITVYDYDELKRESQNFDGSPIEFTSETLFKVFLLDKLYGDNLKYSMPRSLTVNDIKFTYYRGESSFKGDRVTETLYTIVDNDLVVLSLSYYGDVPENIYKIAIIINSARKIK